MPFRQEYVFEGEKDPYGKWSTPIEQEKLIDLYYKQIESNA